MRNCFGAVFMLFRSQFSIVLSRSRENDFMHLRNRFACLLPEFDE